MSVRVLSLFGLTTVRSTWTFLVFSMILFVFGVYYTADLVVNRATHSPDSSDIWFVSAWFLATGSYIGLACWALFSQTGRAYLAVPTSSRKRTIFGYLRMLGAGFVGLALILIALMLISAWFGEETCRCEVPGHWECKGSTCAQDAVAHLKEYKHAVTCRRTDWASNALVTVFSFLLPDLKDAR